MLKSTSVRGPALRILIIVAGVLAGLAIPTVASADTVISGTASGLTIPLGGGAFRVMGTYQEASGARGTYQGTYTMSTTGYTSCRAISIGEINCGTPSLPYRCNRISGVVTLRTHGKSITLNIGAAHIAPPGSRLVSGVCLQEGNTRILDTYLMLTNRAAVFPATVEEFSRGYGIFDFATGGLVGTSTPLGGGLYVDRFTLSVNLSDLSG